MKSRPLTYLLLVAAFGVWGVVAWKLFSSGPKPVAHTPTVVITVGTDTCPHKDTLRLDYPDPFLRVVVEKPSVPMSVSARMTVRTSVQQKRSAAQITCRGRIRNQNVDYYLVSINGHVHLLRPGESAEDFTLQQVRNDSLLIICKADCYLVRVP